MDRPPRTAGREGAWVDEQLRVVVYTRAGCTACVTAEHDVERVCAELGCGWAAVDVDGDAELRAEYGDRVPVVMVDGREHGFWRVEQARLRAALGS